MSSVKEILSERDRLKKVVSANSGKLPVIKLDALFKELDSLCSEMEEEFSKDSFSEDVVHNLKLCCIQSIRKLESFLTVVDDKCAYRNMYRVKANKASNSLYDSIKEQTSIGYGGKKLDAFEMVSLSYMHGRLYEVMQLFEDADFKLTSDQEEVINKAWKLYEDYYNATRSK